MIVTQTCSLILFHSCFPLYTLIFFKHFLFQTLLKKARFLDSWSGCVSKFQRINMGAVEKGPPHDPYTCPALALGTRCKTICCIDVFLDHFHQEKTFLFKPGKCFFSVSHQIQPSLSYYRVSSFKLYYEIT